MDDIKIKQVHFSYQAGVATDEEIMRQKSEVCDRIDKDSSQKLSKDLNLRKILLETN